jgi:hypothetical protein
LGAGGPRFKSARPDQPKTRRGRQEVGIRYPRQRTVNDYDSEIELGPQLAVGCSQVREHRKHSHADRTARMIRDRVRSSAILHSHTRSTLHPSFRSLRATLRSRLRFDTTFDRQNFLLLFDGRSQQGHPCQKHPSTNRATLGFGHAKSGFPATGHCFLNPSMPRLRSISSILRSVVPPNVRTDAMIFDRTSRDTLSIAYRFAYLFKSSGWIESAGTS